MVIGDAFLLELFSENKSASCPIKTNKMLISSSDGTINQGARVSYFFRCFLTSILCKDNFNQYKAIISW